MLFLVAMELLTSSDMEQPDTGDDAVNVALVPLGIPLLAGPGAIVAVMVSMAQAHTVGSIVGVVGAVVATHVVIWLSMRFAYRARPLRVPNPDDRGMEVYQKAIEPMRRVLAWLVPLGVGLFVGFTQAMPHWREILLAFNSSAFGVKDPQWGLDVSFYIFILPLLRTLIRLLVSITVTAAIFSLGTHYLYGGITFAPRFKNTSSARVQLTNFSAI